MNAPAFTLPSYELLPEPELLFHPDREQDTDLHPLRGLLTFGPYSRKMPLSAPDPIRLAVICPDERLAKLRDLVQECQTKQRLRERKNYLLDFEGFSKVFGVGLDMPHSTEVARIQLIRDCDVGPALANPVPWNKLAELIFAAVRRLASNRAQFDVLLLYLPDEWSSGFQSAPSDPTSDFDLHDSIKALCSSLHLPVQMLNDRAFSYFCRCSVAWRLSLAVFTKAGGIPWKLAGFESRNAYVGLSYCMRKSPEPKFVTCCSQIFDAQGTNLQFLLYETHDGRYEGRNPYLPRNDMRRVMARTLSLYQHQKGQPPVRLVLHKTTQFTRDEIDGCIDALGSVEDLELLTLTETCPWEGIKIDAPKIRTERKGQPAAYPLERGICLPIGGYEFLLWTQGNCHLLGSSNFYKEGKGIPRPLRVTRYVGAGSCHASGREILGLTKMNWNNDSLYDYLPVTNSYASILARIVKRMGSLSSQPYDFRYFM